MSHTFHCPQPLLVMIALTIFRYATLAIALIVGFVILKAIYNVFFHPLRNFPGPLRYRASRIFWVLDLIEGRQIYTIDQFHKRYGPVVRTAPDELSFTIPEAWRDIYGHRVGLVSGLPEIPKWPLFYKFTKQDVSIFNAPQGQHGTLRRALAHGFSEKSTRAQESIIGGYVDLLVTRLKEVADSKAPANMVQWYNYTTFDIVGDLVFGNSFHCLDNANYHPWVSLFADSTRQNSIFVGLKILGLDFLALATMPLVIRNMIKHFNLTKEWLRERRKLGTDRGDLIEGLLKKEGEGINFDEIHGTSMGLIFAGSETTATLLSGVTYLLLQNPKTLAKVTMEVRSSFKSDKEITLLSVQNLDYMLACLDEAFRLYPPVGIGLPRQIPKGGVKIAGIYVPEGSIVDVPQYAIHRSPDHWTEPESFHPERFLGDSRFASDKVETLQPFAVGPRNCIGRKLVDQPILKHTESIN
ncbi:cytochrome P450, putative [Talaromyces stipitatus ATCC 10500]|uniref:Cytochrome P450, putative n=1 Tax=Talaromyces stipitatus (strain ATCC 10500 / CBS 375.48 / QM 6759 / NRRL 1006) TaxID=441959 RepID=B8MV63_TALSN|nr:cytochrome P450, putative [Talaromyces stipitatus ATCC 10500]EED11519.1 cytochrome P450, putative [Talaromyces stipitatus ATCC 10500]